MIRVLKVAVVAAVMITATSVMEAEASGFGIKAARNADAPASDEDEGEHLSDYWGVTISQWEPQIIKESKASGLDADFIAAVIQAESNGNASTISRAGAVGLMGVMPTGPGLEGRPTAERLENPGLNINWGVAILTSIIRQSGGDISSALAAYSGGWDFVNSQIPKQYAQQVLDDYGRAVAVRSGVSPEIAARWSIAIQIRRGNIPAEKLILADEPVSGLHLFGEHVVYNYIDDLAGISYYVRGYAVPLALIVPLGVNGNAASDNTVDDRLLARLGMSETKIDDSNPRVLLACLPSLSRLRGELVTRWYAPTQCPSWHR
ncbi:MAG: transglycosylase SLT domain-containing protein [Candidatus Promineifilaceae bacterium]